MVAQVINNDADGDELCFGLYLFAIAVWGKE